MAVVVHVQDGVVFNSRRMETDEKKVLKSGEKRSRGLTRV